MEKALFYGMFLTISTEENACIEMYDWFFLLCVTGSNKAAAAAVAVCLTAQRLITTSRLMTEAALRVKIELLSVVCYNRSFYTFT